MRATHLRDKQIPRMAIHFDVNIQPWQLTDDPAQVTCKRCRRMMERKAKYEAKRKSNTVKEEKW